MIKTGTVKNTQQIKTGVANGRSWTLWKITLEDGFQATTFENIYSPGQQVNLSVEEKTTEKNGVQYQNYQIVPSKPRKESVVAQNSKFEEIMKTLTELQAQIRGLDQKVDQLLDDLAKRP